MSRSIDFKVCDRCGIPDRPPVHHFDPPACGWSAICADCHHAYKTLLQRLLGAVARMPERTVESLVTLAEGYT